MKVKELITKLLECDPELDVAYEHCSVDYCEQHDQEKLVEMGDQIGRASCRERV